MEKHRFTVRAVKSFSKDNKELWTKDLSYTCVTQNFKTFLITSNEGNQETIGENSILIQDFNEYFDTAFRLEFPYPAEWLRFADRDRIYREVWAEHVKEDALAHFEEEYGETIDEGDAEIIAERYVFQGDYDCNQSYWNNLEAIKESL